MKEEEIEVNDMKGENSEMGAEDQGEESSFLENEVEENPGKDSIQDQDMPLWRLPRYNVNVNPLYGFICTIILPLPLLHFHSHMKRGRLADPTFLSWELI